MAAEYEIIAAQLLRVNSRNHAAWNNWGVGIFNEALELPDDVSAPLFEEATRKYAIAADLAPREPLYWQNWGGVLLQQAIRATDEKKLSFFQDACLKYERAVRLRPGWHSHWWNLGTCYLEWAKRTDVKLADPLYYEAYVRYAVVAEILEPHNLKAWFDWGGALLTHAARLDGAESVPLFMEASEKFERCCKDRVNRGDALNNGAVALIELAKRLPDVPGAKLWLANAESKLTDAISLSPDNALYWFNRGTVRYSQARNSVFADKKRLLAEADAEMVIAHRLNPDPHATLINWGNIDAELASLAGTDAESITLLREAEAKYSAAIAKEPGIPMYWINWGVLYLRLAMDAEPEQAITHCEEACAKYIVANGLQPDNFEALIGWSETLTFQAKHTTDDVGFADLLSRAEEKAERAMRLKPESFMPYNINGLIGTRRAVRESDADKRNVLLENAVENLRKSNEIKPNKATFALARIAAIKGNTVECRRLLEDAEAHDVLLVPRQLARDEDLLSVRDEEWFRQLLERLPR
ncbi:MAG: hypothetical protein H8F28_12040 [Fibrella sp.]|nr:hypothetical protein [Armatimonadota bacterium]